MQSKVHLKHQPACNKALHYRICQTRGSFAQPSLLANMERFQLSAWFWVALTDLHKNLNLAYYTVSRSSHVPSLAVQVLLLLLLPCNAPTDHLAVRTQLGELTTDQEIFKDKFLARADLCVCDCFINIQWSWMDDYSCSLLMRQAVKPFLNSKK